MHIMISLLLTNTRLESKFSTHCTRHPIYLPGHCKEEMLSMLPSRKVSFENKPITTTVETYGYHKAKWYFFAFFQHFWEVAPLAQTFFIPQIYQVLSKTSALCESTSESSDLKHKLTGPLRYQQRSASSS